jgi:hypothetical protein
VNAALAALGACLGLIGNLAYLRDMIHGRTVAHRGSWLVWSVIAVLAAASHGAEGGRWSLVVLGCQAAGTVAVWALATTRGVGGLSPGNLCLLALAGAGVLGWLTASDPLVATLCAVLADGAGLVAVVPKIWRDPGSETLATYALAGATGLLACLTVASFDVALLLFPLYYCLANAAVAHLIVMRRRGVVPVPVVAVPGATIPRPRTSPDGDLEDCALR